MFCLLGIAGTYREYRMETKKKPYLQTKEWLPQLDALEQLAGGSFSETIRKNLDGQEYVTAGDVRDFFMAYPQADSPESISAILQEYRNDSRYMGLEDWNTVFLQIVERDGGETLYTEELTILGNPDNVTDAAGKSMEEEQVLTQKGVYDTDYWNMDAWMYHSVKAVCYRNTILTVVDGGKEEGRLSHVYVMDGSEQQVRFFVNDYYITYEMGNGSAGELRAKEKIIPGGILDLIYDNGQITAEIRDTRLLNGRLLQVSEKGIEVEGYGIYEPQEDMKVYRLYGIPASLTKEDLCIGYDFTDLVLEDGKVAACLVMKEEDMDTIRVLLNNSDYRGRYHESFQAVCDQDLIMVTYENGMEISREEKKAGESIFVSADDMDQEGWRIRLSPQVLSAKTKVASIKRSQGEPLYKGSMEIVGSKDGLIVINEVLLEDYLCTVVPSEMPASYPSEALKAQAVCARTYAYEKMLHAGILQFGAHVDDSTAFQVYNNISEQPETTDAVKATHNTVAFYEDAPLMMYYYSTSCGAGTDTAIWHGSDTVRDCLEAKIVGSDPLTAGQLADEETFREWIGQKHGGHYESEEGWYRWTYTVDDVREEEICSVLQKRYENNPALILTENDEGKFSSIPITRLGKILDMKVVKRLNGGVADELLITGTERTVKVISELNIRYVLCDRETKVIRQTMDEVSVSLLPSAYFILDPVFEDGCVTGYKLTGGGFGHGVGMSQNGAKCMAENGMGAEEILQFFYPSVQLEKLNQ